ncbi:hypothetical protein KKC00_02620 [Patescibacteria group bacterium]|nr:hypothetical protein [Patescibacteria group bacterium]
MIKYFNKTVNFITIFKPILFYELGIFCFFFINPIALVHLFKAIIPYRFLSLIELLIIVGVSFFIFNFVMQKFSLLNFKKALIVFFVMFLIVTPIVLYVTQQIAIRYVVEKFPVFSYDQPPSQTFSQVLLTKIDGLNDIFLEGEFMSKLFQFTVTFSI